jgi:hypothetical protein
VPAKKVPRAGRQPAPPGIAPSCRICEKTSTAPQGLHDSAARQAEDEDLVVRDGFARWRQAHVLALVGLSNRVAADGLVPLRDHILDRNVKIRVGPLEILVANVAAVFAAPRCCEQLRRRAWTDMLQHLSRFQPQPGHPPARAIDIMMVIMSPATYQAFVNDYRWTPGQWQELVPANPPAAALRLTPCPD